MHVIEGAGLVGLILLASFVVLILKLASSTRVRGVDPEWIQHFSISSYRPMERLLSEDDVEFLKSQPGYEPGMEKSLRRARRKIYRAYLRNLGQDFNRLHLALRLAALHSPEDRPDLAGVLVKQKGQFFVSLGVAHVQLALHAAGIGRVDARGLLATLDTMRTDLQGMLPVAMNASA
ncbi:MAG: hypothetical protein KIT09_10560 [Bryobacteraceae bacterium]|nr:hypothetical protein [Bryobacteraceae bacterium]